MSDFIPEAITRAEETKDYSKREHVLKSVKEWLRDDYGDRITSRLNIPENMRDKDWYEDMANLNNNLTRALYTFYAGVDMNSRDEFYKIAAHEDSVRKVLLTGGESLVATARGEKLASDIESCIVGSVSTLTFINMIKDARPDLKLNPSRIFPSSEADALGSVDMFFEFPGHRNPYSEKPHAQVVNLVQIKTGNPERLGGMMHRIEPGSKTAKQPIVSRVDVQKMVSYGDFLVEQARESGRDITVQYFLAVVPGYTERGDVRNVFGFYNSNGDKYNADFRFEAEKAGFFPDKV